MEKEKIAAIAGAALGAAALVFAFGAKSKVSSINSSLDFDKTVNVSVSGLVGEDTETESEGAVIEVDENGIYYVSEYDLSLMSEEEAAMYSAMIETGEAVLIEEEEDEEVVGDASFNLILRDGSLKVLNSTVKLTFSESYDDGTTFSDDVFVYLSGENTLEYDSAQNYLIVNDSIVIQTISTDDVTYVGIAEFVNNDGAYVLIGERQLTEEVAVAVVYTLDASSSYVSDDDVSVVQSILNNATTENSIETFSLFGLVGNTDWLEDIVMTNKAIELIKGESAIYITPYTGSFADGTTNTLAVGSITIDYCESAKDTSNGYIPYIYTFDETHNGLFTDGDDEVTLKVKLLAVSNGSIKNLFNVN